MDRQLQMIDSTRLEWWGTSKDHPDNAQVGNEREMTGDIHMVILDRDSNRQSSGVAGTAVTRQETV